jgi:hypothetical protein
MPACSVGSRELGQPRTLADGEACYGEPQSFARPRKEASFWRQLWSVGMAANAVPNCVIWAHLERVQLTAMRAADDYRAM